jgi:hypothetical protein
MHSRHCIFSGFCAGTALFRRFRNLRLDPSVATAHGFALTRLVSPVV